MEQNPYLTETELLALQMLAEEKSSAAIKRECRLMHQNKCPANALPLFLLRLKKKTGIQNPRDPQEVRVYLAKIGEKLLPSEAQLDILARVLGLGPHNPHSWQALGFKLNISPHEALQKWREALQAIGVFTDDESQQRVQARIFFASRDPLCKPFIPLSKVHIEAARLMAKGAKPSVVADILKLPMEQALEVCEKVRDVFGAKARGRGVKARLIEAALLRYDAQTALEIEGTEPSEPITMDDPAF